MAYDIEEQEKLDALRDWWAQYGTLIVILAFAAAAAVAGWRGWQWYEGHRASQAMGYYEALETAVSANDDESLARVRAASTTLRDDFPKSGYTSRGVLLAAHALQNAGDLEAAGEQLRWLSKHSADPALAELARLRLAGVLLEQEKFDEALAQLDKPAPAYSALFADRRGDILLAQGKKEDAIKQWELALAQDGVDSLASIIRLKLDALAGA